ncbi:MAG TPA: hypothetical protein ENN13_05295 [Candidatus Altiarchaeales archaeon]|nr:hypothetical protein [Candidatus Altiarchaeales archaeon]
MGVDLMRKSVSTVFFILLLSTLAPAQQCSVDLKDEKGTVQLTVETCESIGSFSLGGLYENKWERLTYHYPKPWAGTFITVHVDGKYYSTSTHPQNSILLDGYSDKKPYASGNSIITSWSLPEGIDVTQTITLLENQSIVDVKAENKDGQTHLIGVRIHVDTMLGTNDGAPIYVPGKGLQTSEVQYAGNEINFKYWKAYNKPWDPTIVATSFINPFEEYTLPSKMIIANWKQSKNTAWDYNVNASMPVTGDSAVILYYTPERVPAGGSFRIKSGYGSEKPVLPVEKGEWGLTEILVDKGMGDYCPDDVMTITVDGLSSRIRNTGKILLNVYANGKEIHSETKLQVFDGGVVSSTQFKMTVPETKEDLEFTFKATLQNDTGAQADTLSQGKIASVRISKCVPPKPPKEPFNWMRLIPILVILIILIIFGAIILIAASIIYRGNIVLQRFAEGDKIMIQVVNKTRKTLKDCTVVEAIPEGAEIDVETLGVTRRRDRLEWIIGKLAPGEEALLEYRIMGKDPESNTILNWSGGSRQLN